MLEIVYKWTRWVIGAVFIYAGGVKLLDPRSFAVLIEAYGIVPEKLLMVVAVALPVLEVGAGLGLMFDIRGSLSAVTGMLLLFIGLLTYGIWMGLDVDCGCFGAEDPEAKAFHGLGASLDRDFVMLAGVAFLHAWRRFRGVEPLKIGALLGTSFKKRRKDALV